MTAAQATSYSPRELLLAAAARAVITAFRQPLTEERLDASESATLRVLEAALELYEPDAIATIDNPPP